MPYTDWDPKAQPEPPKYVDTPLVRVRVFSMEEYNYTVNGKALPPVPLPGVNPRVLHYKNDKAGLAEISKQ